MQIGFWDCCKFAAKNVKYIFEIQTLKNQLKFLKMKEENKKEEIQSRREFFKNAAKAVLPVVGAVALANVQILAHASNTSSMSCPRACKDSCAADCTGCSTCCQGGCKTTCSGTCHNTCSGTCKYHTNK